LDLPYSGPSALVGQRDGCLKADFYAFYQGDKLHYVFRGEILAEDGKVLLERL
jgi:hypothetical protein